MSRAEEMEAMRQSLQIKPVPKEDMLWVISKIYPEKMPKEVEKMAGEIMRGAAEDRRQAAEKLRQMEEEENFNPIVPWETLERRARLPEELREQVINGTKKLETAEKEAGLEPDEIDIAMLKKASEINDGTTVSLDSFLKDLENNE
jgi:hypothetical protein